MRHEAISFAATLLLFFGCSGESGSQDDDEPTDSAGDESDDSASGNGGAGNSGGGGVATSSSGGPANSSGGDDTGNMRTVTVNVARFMTFSEVYLVDNDICQVFMSNVNTSIKYRYDYRIIHASPCLESRDRNMLRNPSVLKYRGWV